MVSVIMLTYNHAQYVKKALDSVLAQRADFPFEILIGDDASSDGTPAVLAEYQSSYPDRIRVFYSDVNQGTTRNAYRLFLAARGKYLASCEGDDYWTDADKLQKQVDFLEAHPEYVGCSHEIDVVNEDGKRLNKRVPWISKKRVYTIRDFKGLLLPGHSSSIVRRNIFLQSEEKYPVFWELSRYVGDRTAAVLWSARGKFYRFPERMSAYRFIRDEKKENVTSQAFLSDAGKNRREFEYTERLRAYAKEECGLELDFDYYKRRLLVSALYFGLVRGDAREKALVSDILKSLKHPAAGLLAIPYITAEKAVRRLLNQ